MGTKISIRLDARQNICLCYGSNGTKVNLRQVLNLKGYNPKDFVSPIKGNKNNVLNDNAVFFNSANVSQTTLKNYAYNNEVLRKFFNACIDVISNESNNVSTAKELVMLATGKNTERPKTMTLGSFLDIVINLYKYDNPNKNALACTFQHFITLKNKLAIWKDGKVLNANISTVNNDTFISFGNWIKDELKGANYRNLMKDFRHVMNLAIKEYHKETSCTVEANKFTYPFNSKENQPISNLSDLELKQKTSMDVLTKKQVESLLNYPAHMIGNYSKSGCNIIDASYNSMLLDVAKFIYESSMRPIDVIRLTTENTNVEKGYFVYMPHKFNRFRAASESIRSKHTFIKEFTPAMLNIYDKHNGTTGNTFVFNLPCNRNTTYNYPKINKVIMDLNALLQDIAETLGIETHETVTAYTLRKTRITEWIKEGINPNIIATWAGTSAKMVWEHYYQYQEQESNTKANTKANANTCTDGTIRAAIL